MNATRLIQACQSDTAILTSTIRWFEEEEEKTIRRMALIDNEKELYRVQGEARAIRKLRDSLAKAARLKEDDKSRIRAVR
jgi:hypothetical protein